MGAALTDEPKPRRRKWWLAGGAALAVVVLVTATLLVVNGGSLLGLGGGKCASDGYEETEFTTEMEPVAISPNGKYIVGPPTDFEVEGFGLWHDGEYEAVTDAPGDWVSSEDFDVNDSGVVLGESSEDGETVFWTYADGEFRRLEGSNGSPLLDAVAINNDGTIAGQVGADDDLTPAVLKPGETAATRLEIPADRNGWVEDISEAGVVVGSLSHDGDEDTSNDAWLWDANGKGVNLLSKADFGEDWDREGSASADAVNGDWVLIMGRPETIRVNIADGYHADAFSSGDTNTIDEFGRVFTTRKGMPVAYDDKAYPLPGMQEPPEHDGSEEDPVYNEVLAASADGSVVYGKGWNDNVVLWRCR